jgi:hypothetical protein
MLQRLRLKFGSLRANKHTETLMQAVSEGIWQTANLNIIFACCLATHLRSDITALSSDQAHSPQAWKQGVDILTK